MLHTNGILALERVAPSIDILKQQKARWDRLQANRGAAETVGSRPKMEHYKGG
jgi:hypothetical protein